MPRSARHKKRGMQFMRMQFDASGAKVREIASAETKGVALVIREVIFSRGAKAGDMALQAVTREGNETVASARFTPRHATIEPLHALKLETIHVKPSFRGHFANAFMSFIAGLAAKSKVPLALQVEPIFDERVGRERLAKWFGFHGFKRMQGREDFMVREPLELARRPTSFRLEARYAFPTRLRLLRHAGGKA